MLSALLVAIAIVANFARAFFLVWVAATQNISAVDRWHDVAGYTIVGVVFVGSLGLSAWLGKGGHMLRSALILILALGSTQVLAEQISCESHGGRTEACGTVPPGSSVAVWAKRLVAMGGQSRHRPSAGSYFSAVVSPPPPPTTRT